MISNVLKEFPFGLRNNFLWANLKQMSRRTTTKVTINPVRKSTDIIASLIIWVKFPVATFYKGSIHIIKGASRIVITNSCLYLIVHLVHVYFNIIERRVAKINRL